jgi:hypothetical protein
MSGAPSAGYLVPLDSGMRLHSLAVAFFDSAVRRHMFRFRLAKAVSR